MSTAARITALGRALRHAAGEFSGDTNECCYLAHQALGAMLHDDPSLKHLKLGGPESDRAMRKALWAVDLASRSTAAETAASRRALLSP